MLFHKADCQTVGEQIMDEKGYMAFLELSCRTAKGKRQEEEALPNNRKRTNERCSLLLACFVLHTPLGAKAETLAIHVHVNPAKECTEFGTQRVHIRAYLVKEVATLFSCPLHFQVRSPLGSPFVLLPLLLAAIDRKENFAQEGWTRPSEEQAPASFVVAHLFFCHAFYSGALVYFHRFRRFTTV